MGLVNGSATKVNSYSYDPYGVQLSASQQIANPWRYAFGMYDGQTGLTKFGARYYDPGLGRFTQRDPLARTSRTPMRHAMQLIERIRPDLVGNASWARSFRQPWAVRLVERSVRASPAARPGLNSDESRRE